MRISDWSSDVCSSDLAGRGGAPQRGDEGEPRPPGRGARRVTAAYRATSLFERTDAATFLPTGASAGPWSPGVLHGGAVGALLGGLLEDPDQVLVRVLVELMAPVPSQALRAEVGAVEGGRRVVRQTVELRAGDRPVARTHGLRMRRDDLERSEEPTSEL